MGDTWSAEPSPAVVSVVGGLRNQGNVTWPLARLEVSANGVQLSASVEWLRFLVPTYRFAWDDLERVEYLPGTLGFRQVRFVLSHPVDASRPASVASWPLAAREPTFWILPEHLDRVKAAIPARLTSTEMTTAS